MESEWIVPFKGRGTSGAFEQNFLWRKGSIYIMDNHRAALWCWLQHIQAGKKYNLFHIDRHTDTLYSRIEEWKKSILDLSKLPIDSYLALRYHHNSSGHDIPVIQYGNYLSIFLECYPEFINQCLFATHNEGDEPKWLNKMKIEIWETADTLIACLKEREWIVNVDLDYFFYYFDEKDYFMFSDEYVEHVFSTISEGYKDGAISVLTISLSPEYSGGWESAEELSERICQILGLDFSLPI